MSVLIAVLGLTVFAGLASLIAGKVLISSGPRDYPDGDRKSQATAMPTAGGIAVVVGSLPMTAALFFLQPDWATMTLLALFFCAFCMFLMGIWDDITGLPALPKLAVQLVLALIVAALGVRVEFLDLGRHYFEVGMVMGILGSAAWLVVVTNAVNFMDGSDGLAVGSSATISTGIAGIAFLTGHYDIAAMAAVFTGALLGLLFWNGRGKLYAGDTGALVFGFYLGSLALLLVDRLGTSVWIAPCLFIGFLADVLLTLIWRFRHKRSLLKPHREHIYQLIIAAGRSHAMTALIFVWVSLHGLFVAGVSLFFPRGAAMAGFLVLVAILFWISHKIRRSAIENGYLVP